MDIFPQNFGANGAYYKIFMSVILQHGFHFYPSCNQRAVNESSLFWGTSGIQRASHLPSTHARPPAARRCSCLPPRRAVHEPKPQWHPRGIHHMPALPVAFRRTSVFHPISSFRRSLLLSLAFQCELKSSSVPKLLF